MEKDRLTPIVVRGNVPSKANQYDISIKGGRPSFRKKDVVVSYEESFLSQVWPDFDFVFRQKSELPDTRMMKDPFELLIRVYYKTKAHDLDNAFKTVLDCCQQAKLIANDNLCMHIHGYKYVDKDNPRVEFVIRRYDGKAES